MYTHNPSTKEAEAGGSGDQGQPSLHSEFEDILGTVKSCLKTSKQASKQAGKQASR